MGSKTPSSTTTTTRQEIDPELKAEHLGMLENAKTITGRDDAVYGGERVAGFTADQTAAQAGIRNMQGQAGAGIAQAMNWTADTVNGYQPMMVGGNYRASNINAGQLSGTDIASYIDPSLAARKSAAIAENNRAVDASLVSNADQQIGGGWWGGSRADVQNGVTKAEGARNAASISATLDGEAWDRANANAQFDIGNRLTADTTNAANRYAAAGLNQQGRMADQQAIANAAQMRLSGAGQYANLAGAGQTAATNDLALLSGSGEQQQALDQSQLDLRYSNWFDKQSEPLRDLQIQQSFLAGIPLSQNGSQTTPVAAKNRALGAAGGAMSGAAMGATVGGPYGAAIGGIAGGIYGAFG